MVAPFRKENDYTLVATTVTEGGGTISRYFNFAAQQVTTLYEREARANDRQESRWGASGSVATSVSVALASDLTTQKFSELDSLAEVRLMFAELTRLGGKPPALEGEEKKAIAAPKLATGTP